MASSPRTPLIPATVTPTIPTTVTPLTITPASKILGVSTTPLTNGSYEESVIWKRIRDANVDEESIRRRDKASLIAYIAKLEAQEDLYAKVCCLLTWVMYVSSL